MWTPPDPHDELGYPLTAQEAWRRAFHDEFHELADGAVDDDWLHAICDAIYPLALDAEPRRAAKLVYVTLTFEMPEFVETELAARERSLRLKAVGPWLARCLGPWPPR